MRQRLIAFFLRRAYAQGRADERQMLRSVLDHRCVKCGSSRKMDANVGDKRIDWCADCYDEAAEKARPA